MLHFTPLYKPSKGYMGAYNGRGDIGVGCLSMWIKLHNMGKYSCACDQNGYMDVYAEYLVYDTYWSIYGNYCMFFGSAHLQSMQ